MPSFGLYTLANDTVFDQFVALINSIEENVGSDIPICVIPYNRNIENIQREISTRNNVTLFENWLAIERWDNFFNSVWQFHPRTKDSKLNRPGWYGGFVHRKFAAFEGNFDRFVFYNADTLAMKPLDDMVSQLHHYDLVFNDWEHTKRRDLTELNLDVIEPAIGLQEAEIRPLLHCDRFFAARRGMFNDVSLMQLKKRLVEDNQLQWIRDRSWWSSSAMFNYLTLAQDCTVFNVTLSPNESARTGNCANADLFVNQDNVLYNADGLKPIHRIHYTSYASRDFARLCGGEDVDIPHKDVFLHYRFLKTPDQKPQALVAPKATTKLLRLLRSSRRVIAAHQYF
ncbi:Npun_R2821/Npun_R2822 family protein [Myxacorys almedinensis]|uniref:Methionine synthase n=1 Tax=Myxacorys almedinensis A TaxID=2690445 RepID=A0A8J7Z110_9CYAN|nr:Npun_R2821/Npun_R2822 family protein [Myxacorys almedinensis]NDJ18312.1 methionine synthase [Myxacorys almedinensis A]